MTTNPESLLACCPHCWGNDAFVERADFSSCYVVCNDCGARGPVSCDENEADAEATEAGEAEPGEMAARRLWNRRTTPSQPAPPETVTQGFWLDLCEKSDRTSPEEYPDMCLITEEELADMLRYVHRLATRPAPLWEGPPYEYGFTWGPPAQPGREEVVERICPFTANHAYECAAECTCEHEDFNRSRRLAAEPLLARQDWPKELDTSASMSMDFERRYDASPAQDVRQEAEPVAWMYGAEREEPHVSIKRWPSSLVKMQCWIETPLYAHPATLPTEPASVREERLREAAAEVLTHRVGDLPGRGWLRDNDASRAALARLAAALSTLEPANG